MRALLVSRDSGLYAEIVRYAGKMLTSVAKRASVSEALDDRLETVALLLVDARGLDLTDTGALERLAQQYPGAHLILLSADPQSDLLIRAMRAGAREVLQLPLDPTKLQGSLELIAVTSDPTARNGTVLAFVGAKGGSGTTFVSTNLAYALFALAGKNTLLIDLHGAFGDAPLYVSQARPARTLADLCRNIHRLDGALLDRCLVRVTPGFGVLASPEDAAQATDIKPEHIERILQVARKHYDYTLLDVGRQINPVSLRALDGTDTIYTLMQLSLPDIRDARRLFEIFRGLNYEQHKIRLIVNRYEKGGMVSLQDVHAALGVPVAHAIPNDYVAVTNSVNQGKPAVGQLDNSAVARSLTELVEIVCGRRATGDERKGLLGRIFSRSPSVASA